MWASFTPSRWGSGRYPAEFTDRYRGHRDISWLPDESLQAADDLPEPEAIAATIMEKRQVAMTEMATLTALLEDWSHVKDFAGRRQLHLPLLC